MSYVDEFGRERDGYDARDLIPQRRRRDSDMYDDREERRGGRYRGRSRSTSPPRRGGDGYDARFGGRLGGPVRRSDRGERDRPDYRSRSHHHSDPMTLSYLVDWKAYAGWLREQGVIGERPEDSEEDERQYAEIMERFNAFKAEWYRAQNHKFFEVHRQDEWLLEKYHPDRAERRALGINTMKQLLHQKFQSDLQAGKYDAIDLDDVPAEEPTTAEGDVDATDRVEQARRTVSIRTVPLTLARSDMDTLLRPLEGFVYLTLSEPRLPSSSSERSTTQLQSHVPAHLALGARAGWAVFDSADHAEAAVEHLRQLRDQQNSVAAQLSVSIQQGGAPKYRTTVVDAFVHPDRMQMDLAKVHEIAHRLDEEAGIQGGVQTLAEHYPEAVGKTLLDKVIMYLRRVHLYCYYSAGAEAESMEELVWKCGDKVFRKQGEPDLQSERNVHFLTTFDAKVQRRFEPPTTAEALVELGGINLDTCVDDYLAKYVYKEQESRYRCEYSQCGKLFKDTVFVIKHIKNKHAADVQGELEDVQARAVLLNRYVSDAHHLMAREAQNLFNPTAPLRAPRQATAPRGSDMAGRGGRRDRNDSLPSRGGGAGEYHYNIPDVRSLDPRGLRSYTDLDAPAMGEITLDYD